MFKTNCYGHNKIWGALISNAPVAIRVWHELRYI